MCHSNLLSGVPFTRVTLRATSTNSACNKNTFRNQEADLYLISHRIILYSEAILIYVHKNICHVSFERGKLFIYGQRTNSSISREKFYHFDNTANLLYTKFNLFLQLLSNEYKL